jgi:hypothetical protein
VLRAVHSVEGELPPSRHLPTRSLRPTQLDLLRLTHLMRCVQDMNYAGSTCICRVPKAHLKDGIVVECTHCGTLWRASRRLTAAWLFQAWH